MYIYASQPPNTRLPYSESTRPPVAERGRNLPPKTINNDLPIYICL